MDKKNEMLSVFLELLDVYSVVEKNPKLWKYHQLLNQKRQLLNSQQFFEQLDEYHNEISRKVQQQKELRKNIKTLDEENQSNNNRFLKKLTTQQKNYSAYTFLKTIQQVKKINYLNQLVLKREQLFTERAYAKKQQNYKNQIERLLSEIQNLKTSIYNLQTGKIVDELKRLEEKKSDKKALLAKLKSWQKIFEFKREVN